MVTQNRPEVTTDKSEKKGRVKLGKLELNKETVKDLTGDEQRKIKGGMSRAAAAHGGLVYYGCLGTRFPDQ
ncbi:MAG TPA: class I lanthipeptide [Pyrinomonadaceae bacterium]|nr:class I lanthipeptide [Pyrinomonadaceae bacterium]